MTDPVEFEVPEGSPPMLLDPIAPEVPLGQIAWVDNSSGVTSWKFTVRVRDADVDQNLTARWRVLKPGQERPPIQPEIDIPVTGTELRDVDFFLEASQLDFGKCHRLDIAVSSAFYQSDDPTDFAYPVNLEDLALGNWWIWVGPGKLDASDTLKRDLVDSCNALESLLDGPLPQEPLP